MGGGRGRERFWGVGGTGRGGRQDTTEQELLMLVAGMADLQLLRVPLLETPRSGPIPWLMSRAPH